MNRTYVITLAICILLLPIRAMAVDLDGQVQTGNGTSVCALVLASGRSMFSCNPSGPFSLPGLPTEPDGSINLQVYAQGFLPYFQKLTNFGYQTVIMQRAREAPVDNGLSDFGPVDGIYRLLRITNIFNDGQVLETEALPAGFSFTGDMSISGNQITQNFTVTADGQSESFSQTGTFEDGREGLLVVPTGGVSSCGRHVCRTKGS